VRDETGNRAFFEREIRGLLGRLYGLSLRLTGDPADAEDLVSDTVVKAWSKLDQLEDRGSFQTWVFRILINTFISARRGEQPETEDRLEQDGEQPFSLFEKLHQPFLLWWSNPERELLNKLLRQDIERALDSLPEGFRTVVVLVDVEGCAYAEVAEALGLPIGTVRSRLSRARSMLQRRLWEQAKAVGLIADPPRKVPTHD
jgi:RNA polymerase sigma-70 factor (ECF subfamily)